MSKRTLKNSFLSKRLKIKQSTAKIGGGILDVLVGWGGLFSK